MRLKVNEGARTKKDLKIANISPFMTLGLEEWVTGSETYVTSVRCNNSIGILEDKNLVEIYKNFYEEDKSL